MEIELTTCQKIGKALRRLYYTHDYKLHNVYMYQWECDFWCLSSSGYAKEIEIKISRSDFKADFKKEQKHLFLSTAKGSPNKFFYACQTGLLSIDEIPSYAGLIYFDDYNCTVVKEAPYIHKEKEKYTGVLLSKYYNKTLNMFSKLLEFRRTFKIGLPENKSVELDKFISKFHFD